MRQREEVCAWVDAHRGEMIGKWRDLVNLEGRFDEKENVEKAQAWFRRELEAEGFRTWTAPSRPDRCGVLLGMLGEERGTSPVIFAGHLDTVHPKGAFGRENPFRIGNGKAFGPGVLDMKGGLVTALCIVGALRSAGFRAHPIKFIVAGEEEGDHLGTDVDLLYTAESRGALCAFNMESGRVKHDLCVGRKGQYTFCVEVRGRGGHAGNEFEKGRNALTDAAAKITGLARLTDLEKGTTVTPSVMHCGMNVTSIPDLCTFAVDVRIPDEAEGERIRREFDRILRTPFVEGTETTFRLEAAKLHPFRPNEKILGLLETVNRAAVENGFAPFGRVVLGGASDTGAIARADVPCSVPLRLRRRRGVQPQP